MLEIKEINIIITLGFVAVGSLCLLCFDIEKPYTLDELIEI
jgi:hypothetical protein